MALISIVIPCYNSEEYIEKCLRSISDQTFQDYEVILVDDSSSDRTVSLANNFINLSNLNAKIIENTMNQGPSISRKIGIEASNSEYVAFCDSDDWIDKEFLENMYLACANKNIDIVFCNYQSVYSNGKIIKHDIVSSIKNSSKKELIGRSVDSMCCMMVRKSIFDNIIFPNLRNGEDMAIIPLIVAFSNSFGFVEKHMYNYFYHVGSLSKTYTESMIYSLKESFKYIQSSLGNDYPDETEFLGIRNYLYGGLLNLFKDTFDINRAKHILDEFEYDYPKWEKNYLFQTLPIYKKVYLRFAKFRMLYFCYIASKIHKAISR